MAQVLPVDRFNQSIEQLQGLQKQLQAQLVERQQWLATRVDDTKTQIERRQQLLLGQTRDQQLLRLYALQQRALDLLGQVIERLEHVAPLGKAALQQKHDQLVALLEEIDVRKQALHTPKIDNYDDLNVKQINAHLDQLNYYELSKLKTYEQTHKNRVTVLREVEKMLD